jgi:cytochrome c-type biogenesis protein
MKALPGLVQLYNSYKDSGLVVVGLDGYDSAKVKTLKEFLDKRNVNYPVVITNSNYALINYGVRSYPTVFIVDKNGNLVSYHEGWSEEVESVWKEEVLRLLRE